MNSFNRLIQPLFIVAALFFSFSGSAFAVAGKFQFVNGEVQVINAAGAQHKVQKGDSINEGDTVAAAADGFAQIKMEDGGFFAVRPDTEFKVDTFQFNGKEDGSEKGVFSLIKGSLRSVTGLIGKKHRDNYKINTATATIGIRGSGADVGHSNSLGTAVRTLFGGHSLTSGGKTIETGPGQTAMAPPGGEPKIVPNFPFSTASGKDNQGKSGGGNGSSGSSSTNSKQNSSSTNQNLGDSNVTIPVKDTDGNNFTNNTTANGSVIGSSTSGPVGSGGAAVGLLFNGSYPFNDFNVVDENGIFKSSVNPDGTLIGWTKFQNGSTDMFALGNAELVVDGTDSSLGVVWGRWGANYTAGSDYNGGYPYQPLGGLAFITGTHITTTTELAAIGASPTAYYGTYSLASGSFPTGVNGSTLGTITSASAGVDFSNNTITNFHVAGTNTVFGSWSVSGSGSIGNFMSSSGISLSGSCTGGSSAACSSMGSPSGTAVGGFVGNQAQGLISTIGLQAGSDNLGGAVYMKRGSLGLAP